MAIIHNHVMAVSVVKPIGRLNGFDSTQEAKYNEIQ